MWSLKAITSSKWQSKFVNISSDSLTHNFFLSYRNRLLELESEGDQLERSFHSYLQRHQERNRLLNKDTKRIWQNYEIGKKLLSTNQATNIKINSLNIVPAAVPLADVKSHVNEIKPDEFDFDQEIDDGFNQNFENPYRIYDFALRPREYSSALQQVNHIHSASKRKKELESNIKQNSEYKIDISVPKLDTHNFPPSGNEELKTTLILEQSTQIATDQFISQPADQVDKLTSTLSQIEPNKEKNIVFSETNVRLNSISPVVDMTLDNVMIPISSKFDDTSIEILSEFNSQSPNEQDALKHMEIQNLTTPLNQSYTNKETDVTIPVQSMRILNRKQANQNNPAEISSDESDVQISVANKSSSSEDFWN